MSTRFGKMFVKYVFRQILPVLKNPYKLPLESSEASEKETMTALPAACGNMDVVETTDWFLVDLLAVADRKPSNYAVYMLAKERNCRNIRLRQPANCSLSF